MIQVCTRTTQELPQRLHAAGAGRGGNYHRRPVCIAYPQPERNRRYLLMMVGNHCSICQKCHNYEDVNLSCAYLYRIDRRWQEAHRIHSRIDQLLETLNMPSFCTVRLIWEQSGNMFAQASGSQGGTTC